MRRFQSAVPLTAAVILILTLTAGWGAGSVNVPSAGAFPIRTAAAHQTGKSPRLCPVSSLTIEPHIYGLSMSGVDVEYILRNVGTAECRLRGAPTLILTDIGGGPTPRITESRIHTPGSRVYLRRARIASFVAHLGNCFTPKGLAVGKAVEAWRFGGDSRSLTVPGVTVPDHCSKLYVSVATIMRGRTIK